MIHIDCKITNFSLYLYCYELLALVIAITIKLYYLLVVKILMKLTEFRCSRQLIRYYLQNNVTLIFI